MPDGDVCDVYVPKWWQTSARKLIRGESTFEGSILWSIKKSWSLGYLTALPELTDAVENALNLRSRGVEGRFRGARTIESIERQHLDGDSQTAARLARAMLRDEEYFSAFCRCVDDQRRIHVGHELLARFSIENCHLERIETALRCEPGRFPDQAGRVRPAKRRGLEELRSSIALRDLAARQLGDLPAPIVPDVALRRANIAVDHRAIAFGAFGSVAER